MLDDPDASGRTALMWAAMANRNPEVIMALLKTGANPKIRSNEGLTAFDCAKYNMRLKGSDADLELYELTRFRF
jgi:ankyrin repeat protein